MCARNRKETERLILPDTYTVKGEREMLTNRDTKRQSKRERRTETVKETVGKKEEIKEQQHLSNDRYKREKDIHVFSDIFQLYLDTFARLLM